MSPSPNVSQVGKINFRPPPKVDSSVVRIEPRPAHGVGWTAAARLLPQEQDAGLHRQAEAGSDQRTDSGVNKQHVSL